MALTPNLLGLMTTTRSGECFVFWGNLVFKGLNISCPCVFKKAGEGLSGALELFYPSGTLPWRKRFPRFSAASRSPGSPRGEDLPPSLQGGTAELAPGAPGLPGWSWTCQRPSGEWERGTPRTTKGSRSHLGLQKNTCSFLVDITRIQTLVCYRQE